ncbi:hypothetical protein GCM10010922_06030 [Microbacterium sorbitolivorans]|uniref:Uncharacterized protein n=1 Tax=Microbacterium sorbitolivorans TaxID=1867410 RepID=A0A367Y890_9MICO|nr:DUF6804 family protein [Microbacterium sorbitolivorans]RCK61262.1 hypothetical protein DTO57_01000 [Microbacterium sorbitolivorans]GGF33662.1 hypothetical protein GCM10010922_06030 [Microbacterium sorbitolivorans]
MASRDQNTPAFQRNALLPSFIAAAVLFLAPVILKTDWSAIVLYVVAIGALIVGWFGVQAKQWWWGIIFLAIAVLWNPAFPFGFDGTPWMVAQFAAAVVFLVAGILIKSPAE